METKAKKKISKDNVLIFFLKNRALLLVLIFFILLSVATDTFLTSSNMVSLARQIAANAGLEGSVIVNDIVSSGKTGFGYNFATGEFVDMFEAGILDPTKVTRSAIQNASSVAAMVLTTESLVADKPDPQADAAAAAAMASQGGGMY